MEDEYDINQLPDDEDDQYEIQNDNDEEEGQQQQANDDDDGENVDFNNYKGIYADDDAG